MVSQTNLHSPTLAEQGSSLLTFWVGAFRYLFSLPAAEQEAPKGSDFFPGPRVLLEVCL